jgi:hypothetical protein
VKLVEEARGVPDMTLGLKAVSKRHAEVVHIPHES